MQLIKHNPAALTLEVPSKSTQRLSIMLTSDVHFDSVVCDLDLFTKHLRIAEQTQSPVLIAGDLLDAMQGKWDPRRQPEDLKHEYAVSAYYDAIVMDCARFLAKFDIPLYILALGNHETGVLRHSNTDLLGNVAYQLRVEHGKQAEAMGYWGYLRVMFKYKHGSAGASKLLYWHHGVSSGAPVTKGMIQVNRQGVYLQAPDFVLNGHNHQSYSTPVPVERMNAKTMQPYTDTVWYLRTPGYKKSAVDSNSVWGFEAEKHRAPTPRGCMFLGMEYKHTDDTIETEILQKIQ
jgi:hypothetical protein